MYGVADCQQYMVWSGEFDEYYYGLLDSSGKVVTPPVYTSIKAIGKDLYLCKPQGVIIDGKEEVITSTNRQVDCSAHFGACDR